MIAHRFLDSLFHCGKRYVCLLSTLAALTTALAGQTVPGKLTYTTVPSAKKAPPDCTIYTETEENFVFTDPSGGKHQFSGTADYTYERGSSNLCQKANTYRSLSTWSTDGLYYLDGTIPPGGIGFVEEVVGVTGHMNPKFIVVGVTYAPPGHTSTVSYQNSTSQGTTTTTSNSFAQAYSESVSVTSGQASECDQGNTGSILGFSGGVCVTGTQSTSYTMQSMNSNSISVVNKTSILNKTTGTPNDFAPVDHDYDLVWLWLNPITKFNYYTNSPKSIQWTGYGYDMADQPAMEIWPVLLGYLNGNFKKSDGTACYAIDASCDPEDAQVLARSWVDKSNPQTWPSGEGPGLTAADLANIAKADPWGANPNYTVTLAAVNPPTTTDGRFTIAPVSGSNSQSFDYKQAGPGNGSGLTQTYTNENTTTTTKSNGNTYTFQEAFGLEEKVGGSFFWTSVQFDFKQTSTFTWVHSFLLTTNNISDSTDSLSITGPPCPAPPPGPCNPLYAGLPEFDVYQDNLFGAFMFWGVN